MVDSSLGLTPFHEIPRSRWSALASSLGSPLTATEIERIRGLGDSLDLDEVDSIYIPLTNLVENIAPTRPRARLILKKDRDHTVSTVLLRKI